MTYCTYITYHPKLVKYYVGKGKTALVENGKYKGSGTRLQNYFNKYPQDQWVTLVIGRWETSEAALKHEGLLVDAELLRDPNCLNLILGGGSPSTFSAETRALISKNGIGRKHLPETREKLRLAHLGRKRDSNLPPVFFSDEHRAKISAANKGAGRPKQSDETKAKRVAKLTGQKRSEESCQRISASLKGKPLSEAHKQALRDAKRRSKVVDVSQ